MRDLTSTKTNPADLCVLVVDDDPFYLNLLQRQLEQLGVRRIRTANDGASALYQLRLDPAPSLIFCDLQMPTMNGLDFMRQLRFEDFRGEIALVSGETERTLATAAQLIRAYGLRLLDSLEKPVRAATLASLIARVGQSSQPSSTPTKGQDASIDLGALLASSRLEVLFQPCLQLATMAVNGLIARASDSRDPNLTPLDPAAMAQFACRPREATQLLETMLPLAMSGCADMLREQPAWWLALDLPVCLLESEDLLEQIQAIARSCDFPLERLRLHLIGAVSEAWSEQALALASQLALRGVALWAGGQDFGYLALERLLQLPLQGMSLDPRLSVRAEESRTAEKILQQLLELASGLKLSTQVNGVESQAQLQLCALAQCDLGTGGFLAPALPASAVPAWTRWYRPSI